MNGLIGLALSAWLFFAWLTHVIVSIQSAKWLLLIAGCIIFPVGCVHGTGVWFGVF